MKTIFRAGVTGSRVDIGVFANNGSHDSAPAMISIDFPDHQKRVYSAQPDGTMRLSTIDYNAKGRGAYFDPLLHWTAGWKDTARYDETGTRLLGWDRVDVKGVSMGFVAHDPGNRTPNHMLDLRNKRAPVLRLVKEQTPVETE